MTTLVYRPYRDQYELRYTMESGLRIVYNDYSSRRDAKPKSQILKERTPKTYISKKIRYLTKPQPKYLRGIEQSVLWQRQRNELDMENVNFEDMMMKDETTSALKID